MKIRRRRGGSNSLETSCRTRMRTVDHVDFSVLRRLAKSIMAQQHRGTDYALHTHNLQPIRTSSCLDQVTFACNFCVLTYILRIALYQPRPRTQDSNPRHSTRYRSTLLLVIVIDLDILVNREVSDIRHLHLLHPLDPLRRAKRDPSK